MLFSVVAADDPVVLDNSLDIFGIKVFWFNSFPDSFVNSFLFYWRKMNKNLN
jgi:hypothetical protein